VALVDKERHKHVYRRCKGQRRVASSAASEPLRVYSNISVGIAAASVVSAGVANRVAHKVASVVMKDCILFLSLILTASYQIVYFSMVFIRKQKGIVTQKMLDYPKWKFASIGLFEAIGLVMQLKAAVHLPGAMIPVLAQSNIPFSLIAAKLILKRTIPPHQLFGSVLVLFGVIMSLKPYLSNSLLSAGGGADIASNALLYSSSYLLAAVATVWKEIILQDPQVGKEGMDVFVINSFCSLTQGLIVLGMMMLVSLTYGSMLKTSPLSYMSKGVECFLSNPGPPMLYAFVNILYNTNIVSMLKKSNAVLTALSIAFVVPLSFIAFSFPIPMIERVPFYSECIKGLCVLSLGIALYNTSFDTLARPLKKMLKRFS